MAAHRRGRHPAQTDSERARADHRAPLARGPRAAGDRGAIDRRRDVAPACRAGDVARDAEHPVVPARRDPHRRACGIGGAAVRGGWRSSRPACRCCSGSSSPPPGRPSRTPLPRRCGLPHRRSRRTRSPPPARWPSASPHAPCASDRGRPLRVPWPRRAARPCPAPRCPRTPAKRTMPAPSIRKQLRTGTSSRLSRVCATPNARTASPFQSLSSGKFSDSLGRVRVVRVGAVAGDAEDPHAGSANSSLLSRRSRSSDRQVPVQSNR